MRIELERGASATRFAAGAAASTLLALLALGCATGGPARPEPAEIVPEPAVRPLPPTEAGEAEGTAPAEGAAPAESAPAEEPSSDSVEGAYGPRTVTIGDSAEEEEGAPQTLAEAAEAARRERRERGESVLVITDENLAEHATGELTIADEPAVPPAAPETPDADDSDAAGSAELGGESPEDYWRRRVLEARLTWRDTLAEIDQLEQEAARLRDRFYAEDDGFYRDSQIKPAWDRALDRLADARRRAAEAENDVARVLEEGRRAGALPGWLREGLEHEPRPDPEEEPIHEPGEPSVVDEDGAEAET